MARSRPELRRRTVRGAAVLLAVCWFFGSIALFVYAQAVAAFIGAAVLALIGFHACAGVDVCLQCRREVVVNQPICRRCLQQALQERMERASPLEVRFEPDPDHPVN